MKTKDVCRSCKREFPEELELREFFYKSNDFIIIKESSIKCPHCGYLELLRKDIEPQK